MDSETKRELDLMWEHGVKAVREDVGKMRAEFREELKEVVKNMASTRRWIVGLVIMGVPSWIALYLSAKR